MTNKGLVDSLRAIADFYEMHPDFPFPYSGEIRCYVSCVPGEAKKQIATFVDYGGAHIEEKETGHDKSSSYAYLTKRFDDGLSFLFGVEKEVLGYRKVKISHVVVSEEWQCGPLLDEIVETKEPQ